MITLLIRTHNREAEFVKCLASISAQTYSEIAVIVAVDTPESYEYATKHLENFRFPSSIVTVENSGTPYHWNLYCNYLKERVTVGWFMYVDDDDWLYHKKCLEWLSQVSPSPKEGIICQFIRGSRSKPEPRFEHLKNGYLKPEGIIRGKIGGSAIVLHHTHKNLADWDGARAADYRFIKAVAEKIPLRFVRKKVVQTGNSGRHGR